MLNKQEFNLLRDIYENVAEKINDIEKIRHVKNFANSLCGCGHIDNCRIDGMDLGCGNVTLEITTAESLFYKILGESSGFEIENKESLITLIKKLADVKREYDKIAFALHEVKEKGYGIVSPGTDELTLAEPKIVKQGGRFGVKLKASAPSIHMICNKPKSLEVA